MSMAQLLASEIVKEGFKAPTGIHNQPPYEAWQLTDNPHYPFGIRSRTGVNCLGALKVMQGHPFAPRSLAEAISAALQES